MELNHISGILLRYTRLWLRDKNIFLIALYWPMLEIVLWGFLGIWMQQSIGAFGTSLLYNIVLWQLFCRASLSLFMMFLEEIISNNLSNLFSVPLRLLEWIVGTMLFACMQMAVIIAFVSTIVVFFYRIPFIMMAKALILFGPALLLSGFAAAFLILAIICKVGKRGQEIAFIINWIFTPFTGIFYPIDVLPPIGQKISYFLPMAHVFNGARAWLAGQAYASYILHAYFLAVVYMALMAIIFFIIFQRTKRTGLTRLSD